MGDDGLSSSTAVPLRMRVKICYGLPRFTIRAAYVIIQVYGQLYYMQLGAKLRFMAFYNAIGRALDVITDPAMGWITDSTRTVCGRRKPYLFIGMFVYTTTLGFLFYPPESGDATLLTHWYGLCYCAFWVVDTFANVPYYALGMELTSDYEHRNSLYFWQHVLGQAGTMIGGVLPALLSDFMGMKLRDAYAITGWSFGAWYSAGVASILLFLKERPLTRQAEDVSPPLVREMLRIYRNQGFMPWMMAYILDYAAIGILATMVPLFSQYVLVEPDSTNCKQQCDDWNPSQTGCTCAKLATEWLGWIMAATFLAASISVPFWHWVARTCKKHTAWLIYSWWNVLTGPFRIFCGKGSLWLTIVLSALNGSAFGGQFIGESVMADLSDYDEFLYGDRAEGMLGVIATLGPKMVLVVCFVVPLAAVATVGFKDSIWPEETVNNFEAGLRPCEESVYIDACPKVPQPQNNAVILITRICVSIVPTLLALCSNFFKWRFPLKRKDQLDGILQGIAHHKRGSPARDPISGNLVKIVEPDGQEEQRQMWALEVWGATIGGNIKYLNLVLSKNQSLKSLGKFVTGEAWGVLHRRAWSLLVFWFLFFAGSLTATVASFHMLEKESTSWVPTSMCICTGSTVVFTAMSALRLKSARQLLHWEVPVALVEAVLSRSSRDDAAVASMSEASTEAMKIGIALDVAEEPSHLRRAAEDSSLHWIVQTQNENLQFTTAASALPCPWHGARPRNAANETRQSKSYLCCGTDAFAD